MGLLKPASNQTAYLKAGILGFQGSGKTFTASEMAVGLAKLSGKDKPKVAFFDTEKGSDFMINKFEAEGIQFDVAKTRTFVDLCAFMQEVDQNGYDVAIIDSISHVWKELMTSYEKKLRRYNGLKFQDWSKVKGDWQRFTDLFINTKLHVIVLGRAGYEYDFEEDKETGSKDLIKTGTKMKAEGEFGYESDLLLEMERIRPENGVKGWIHRCWVLKDRTDTMNGTSIDNPTFEDFRSVISFLNIGGDHIGVDTTRNSQSLIADPDRSGYEMGKQRDIALEELQECLTLNGFDGQSADTKKKRIEVLIHAFGTSAGTAIKEMSAAQIRGGIAKINKFVADKTAKEFEDAPIEEKEEAIQEPAHTA
jgi:hypothetical protein